MKSLITLTSSNNFPVKDIFTSYHIIYKYYQKVKQKRKILTNLPFL